MARRDDLEAVGFVMLYFFKGQLPWQNLPAFSKSDKYRKIKETKLATKLEDLCVDCPKEFLDYMKHCRELEFDVKPNYKYLNDILIELANKEGLNLDDKMFDWVLKKHNLSMPLMSEISKTKISSKVPLEGK